MLETRLAILEVLDGGHSFGVISLVSFYYEAVISH